MFRRRLLFVEMLAMTLNALSVAPDVPRATPPRAMRVLQSVVGRRPGVGRRHA